MNEIPPVQTAQGVYPPRPAAGPSISSVAPVNRPWPAIFATLAVLIALIGSFIIYFLNVKTAAEISSVQARIADVNDRLRSEPLLSVGQTATALAKSLSGYSQAASTQYDFSLLNSEIERLTPTDVNLVTLGIDEKGIVRIGGQANDFVQVGKAFLSYKNGNLLKNVTIVQVVYSNQESGKKIAFTITGALDKQVLKQLTSKTGGSSGTAPATPVPTP